MEYDYKVLKRIEIGRNDAVISAKGIKVICVIFMTIIYREYTLRSTSYRPLRYVNSNRLMAMISLVSMLLV